MPSSIKNLILFSIHHNLMAFVFILKFVFLIRFILVFRQKFDIFTHGYLFLSAIDLLNIINFSPEV